MSAGGLVECVPNFSEGRDASVVAALAAAVRGTAGAHLLDETADADHNRCVLTFAGEAEAVLEAALRAAAAAVERIDLWKHAGVHPRIGALDVLPFVPLEGTSMEECAALAGRAAERLWTELGVPCYLYEAAARMAERRNLAFVRSAGVGVPDVGEGRHVSAGCSAVGARKFLIAYNVNLATSDVGVARAVAREVRESSGGLPCVKALGLELASRGLAQVSMNLTDYEVTPVHVAFEAVGVAARAHGVEVAGSELIGLIPRKALQMAAGVDLRWENFREDMVLEERLRRVRGGAA
ncbi:MAG: glutamate formimidoyltransferase [Acidobacteriota bacterium]